MKMRIKATLLQRTMFYDCVVAMLVAFVVVKSFESFKAIMHKFEQLRAEKEAKIKAAADADTARRIV